jgi:TetR/AcrR family transcriptional repressor of nem operon
MGEARVAMHILKLRVYVGHCERCISNGIAPFCVAGMLVAELPAFPEDVAEAISTFLVPT